MKTEYFTNHNIIHVSKIIKETANAYARGRTYNFSPQKACLLVTDMQNYFFDESSHAFIPSAPAIVPKILRLIQCCISENIPIIYTQHINTLQNAHNMKVWWNDIIREHTPESELHREIIQPNATVITKTQYDAFYQTELLNTITALGKDQMIITGVMTDLCCETTCRSAFIRGIQTFFPVDTTATYTLNQHQGTINNLAFGFTMPLLSEELFDK